MSSRNPFRTRLTRRMLVAGAAAAPLVGSVAPASAQRCPATPPPREKGPLIWLDMDQTDLDDAYDQTVYAFNNRSVTERHAAHNRISAAVLGPPLRMAYGPTEIEKLDIYKTRQPNAPVLIFIHGGSWRGGKAADFALYAEPYVKAGANFVALDFTNVRETKGDLFPMVDQVRRAIAWVYKNAASFGGNPERLFTISRSSGSHLGGCMAISDWGKLDVPANVIKGMVLGSGMYDLKPVRLSSRGQYVKFTDEMEHELSAQRHIHKISTPLVLAIGTLETPEFQRQSRDFAAALQAAGKQVKLIVAAGYNHYEVGESIGNPYGVLVFRLIHKVPAFT